jgi:4-diphosphocytidyl-2-C-methyl-D-erythritol kinase
MQTVDLYDRLTFIESERIEVISELDILQEKNLVYRAAQALRDATGCQRGAAITLIKEIPAGAGLGGGSSDAAAALQGLNILWGLALSARDLAAIGAAVGSDVPFFFYAPCALVEGRGDLVTPMPLTKSAILLLVYPSFGVSTAWAYSALDHLRGDNLTNVQGNLNNIQLLLDRIEKMDFLSIQTCLRNDLQEVVERRYPVVGEIRRRLTDAGAIAVTMSGSGSTVFGLFYDYTTAETAAQGFPGCWTQVVRTLTQQNNDGI